VFSIPQDVLRQLLSVKNTTPERLSAHETEIASRICHCTLCHWLWIRRKKTVPDRCPNCHARAWDRPLLTAMLSAAKPTTHNHNSQEQTKSERGTT
jgi:predicted Zn-ribbon and HTH transcriptional regulator